MDGKLEARMAARRPFGQGEEPALERRMEHLGLRLSAQHRQLDEFFEAVVAAVERGSLVAARAAFSHFDDALDAHVTLEDQIFFPALRGLHRQIDSELVAFVEEHGRFRHSLHELADLRIG